MSRRRAARRARRVQVHFWKHGDPTSYVGYTTNISMTGMFIATRSPYPPGTRLRIEVLEGERGFVIEGMMAHARKIRGELMRLSQPGMGVRFMTVEELVRELIPAAYGQTEEIPHNADRGSYSLSPNLHAEPLAEEPSSGPAPVEPAPPAPPAREPTKTPSRPEVATPTAPIRTAPIAASGGTFSIRFSGTDEFLEVYRRDILQGGLFVSTPFPARLQETVHVELQPPLPFVEPLLVRARVVQRFEPSTDPAGRPNLLSGMGLELFDLPNLVERLQPIVQRMRG